jgi:hypothetical protein
MVSEDNEMKLYYVIEVLGSHDTDCEEIIFWYALYSHTDVTNVLVKFTASILRGKD